MDGWKGDEGIVVTALLIQQKRDGRLDSLSLSPKVQRTVDGNLPIELFIPSSKQATTSVVPNTKGLQLKQDIRPNDVFDTFCDGSGGMQAMERMFAVWKEQSATNGCANANFLGAADIVGWLGGIDGMDQEFRLATLKVVCQEEKNGVQTPRLMVKGVMDQVIIVIIQSTTAFIQRLGDSRSGPRPVGVVIEEVVFLVPIHPKSSIETNGATSQKVINPNRQEEWIQSFPQNVQCDIVSDPYQIGIVSNASW